MSCYGEARSGGDRKRDRQEALQSTIVIEAIPGYPPQRVLRAAVIPRGGTGRASLNFHAKRDATTCVTHVHLQEPEYLSSSTSYIADSVRLKVMSRQHRHDVPNFPGGFFNMPTRNLLEVFATGISCF